MPITDKSFVRYTILLLTVGLIVLVGIVGTTIWLSERNQIYFDQVIKARQARATVVDLRNALQIAESSQRGYLLTGEELYRGPYDAARAQILLSLADVRETIDAYLGDSPALDRLDTAVQEKLTEMDQTMALKRAGNDSQALETVRTDRGKALMDEAQLFFTRVIDTADERLVDAVDNQRLNGDLLRWVTIIGGIIILGVAGGSAFTALRYTRELAQARDEVDILNADLEKRVAERTSDLARANEEIQRFAYIVTHDLRAPLVNIMGFTSELETGVKSVQKLLDEPGPKDDREAIVHEARVAATTDLPEAISFIRTSTRKMDGLINAILKISREGQRALRPEEVDLSELLRSAVGAVQHQVADADGEVTFDLAVPALVSDRLSLEQVFGNLLDNAVKYRSSDRPLRLALRAHPAPANRIVIDLEDNGRGIAPQDCERVFELFRRSGTQDQPGEGIGLAHVRTVVRNLGGDITLSSTLGSGTTFRVDLPRSMPQPQGEPAN